MKTTKPKMVQVEACMTPECGRPANTRGLCAVCHVAFRRAVRAGAISDSEAVERGLALPSLSPGRKPAGPWAKQAALSSKTKKGAKADEA